MSLKRASKSGRRSVAATSGKRPKGTDRDRLVEKLRTHQAELEMQNEKLRTAQEVLTRITARFEAIFTSLSDAVVLTGPDRRIIMVNPAAERLFGYPSKEMLGRSAEMLYADRADFVRLGKDIYSAQALNGVHRQEISYRRKDGAFFIAETVASKVSDAKERLLGFVGIHRDITRRKSVEEELRRSEARQQAIFDHSPAGIYVKDRDGRYVFVNRRTMSLMRSMQVIGDILGKTDRELLSEDLAERFASHDQEIIATGVGRVAEDAILQEDGLHTYLEHKFPLRDASGTIYGLAGIATDISERKRAEEDLRKSERLLAGDLEAMTRLHGVGTLFVHEGNLDSILGTILDAAIAISGADFGNIQLLDEASDSLKIIVQRGFATWWLDYWHSVPKGQGGCGEALLRGERVIVEDVEQSPLFAGTPALEMQRRAGVRAVLSTPLVSRAGRTLGMLSTHSRRPHRPEDRVLNLLDLLSHQTADIIERAQTEAKLRESERRHVLLFERSAIATSLTRLPEGDFVNVNGAFERLLGFSREEVIGKTAQELCISRPEDEAEAVAEMERRGTCRDRERRVRTRDGNERVVLLNSSAFEFSGRNYVLATMQDITERKRVQERLGRTNAVLAEISGLLQEALRCNTDETLGMACLAACERLTQSRFGFIAEMGKDGMLHDLAISDPGWDECKLSHKTGHRRPPGNLPVRGLYGKVMTEGRSFFTNEPMSHPDRTGTPPGHPVLTSFLGVPLLSVGKAVGILAMANREGGFGPVQQEALESLAPVILEAIGRKRAEASLERYRTNLEEHIHRRTEQLQEAYGRLQSILESISDGFFAMDADWRITYVNSEATRIWGISSKNLIGRIYWDAAPSSAGSVFEENFKRAVREQAAVTFEALSPITKTWLEVRAYPYGQGLSVYFHDITARRRRDAERMRLASAIESAAEGVIITDRKGIIEYVNPAFQQITGYMREEIRGRPIHVLDSGRHDDGFYQTIRDALRRSGVWRGQKMGRRKDGSLYFENCIISAVRDVSGDIANYVTICRDETEQLRLEAIASAMNTMDNLGYVFAGVRHEIGNPINNAKMALSVLMHQIEGATRETVESYTKRALTEIGRVERLLRNLKSFNVHEAMNIGDVELAPLFRELLAIIRPDLERRAIVVSSSIGAGIETCRADARALLQILLNLVTNAMDALQGRDDGRILLEAEAEGSSVHLRIRDNGCGITEEQQHQLFRPFFTSKPTGTGLGLVIVRKMLAQMGSSIEIRSIPGEGTIADISMQKGGEHAGAASQDAAGH